MIKLLQFIGWLIAVFVLAVLFSVGGFFGLFIGVAILGGAISIFSK